VMATIKASILYGNTGNDAGYAALIASPGIAIDEFGPYRWNSVAAWGAALAAYDTQNGITDAKVTLLGFRHVNVEGGSAYVVSREGYAFKERGKPRREMGDVAYTLTKASGKWQIDGFAWLSKGGVDQGADADAIVAAIHTAFDPPLDKLDPAALGSAIIDEFPPYRWMGPSAATDWLNTLKQGAAAQGLTDIMLHLAKPVHVSITGDAAYAVVPTVITSLKHGKPSKEDGSFAIALTKDGSGWRITDWAWATK